MRQIATAAGDPVPVGIAARGSGGQDRAMGQPPRRDDEAGRRAAPVVPAAGRGAALEPRPGDEDLPVVARLVVEIRSDGRRTVARGGLEDVASGQRVAIDARGDSPAQLALALARSMLQLPRLAARGTLRGLLGRGKK